MTWKIFKSYLLSKRSGSLIRTIAWFCMLGIAVGVMSLILVVSVMNGFNDAMRARLLAIEPQLVIQVDKTRAQKDIEAVIRKDPLVTQVFQFESQDVIVRTVDGLFSGALAKGLKPDALRQILRELKALQKAQVHPDDGDLMLADLDELSLKLGPREIIMGVDLARSLGVYEGDQVLLIPPEALLAPKGEAPQFERVTVRSILTSRVADIDSKLILYGLNETLAQFKNAASLESGFEVKFQDPYKFASLENRMASFEGVKTQSWIERNHALFFALKMEKIAMTTFLALSALITSFSIVSVMTLLISQKRKDIGIMMAMGLSPRRARRMFARLGLVLSLFGMSGGMFVGLLLCWFLQKHPLHLLPSTVYYDSSIPATINWAMVVIVALSSMVIAFLSAWIPAFRVAKLSPADALRGLAISKP